MQELTCDCGARDLHEGMLVTLCASGDQSWCPVAVTILGFASNSMPSLTAHCGIHISCKLYIIKNSTCFKTQTQTMCSWTCLQPFTSKGADYRQEVNRKPCEVLFEIPKRTPGPFLHGIKSSYLHTPVSFYSLRVM